MTSETVQLCEKHRVRADSKPYHTLPLSALVELVPCRCEPWDALADVDPFTGQPDQHPCGDSCEGICE